MFESAPNRFLFGCVIVGELYLSDDHRGFDPASGGVPLELAFKRYH